MLWAGQQLDKAASTWIDKSDLRGRSVGKGAVSLARLAALLADVVLWVLEGDERAAGVQLDVFILRRRSKAKPGEVGEIVDLADEREHDGAAGE